MASKQLIPSAFRTFFKSMYIGALISLLTATITGSLFVLFTDFSYKTALNYHAVPAQGINSNTMTMIEIYF